LGKSPSPAPAGGTGGAVKEGDFKTGDVANLFDRVNEGWNESVKRYTTPGTSVNGHVEPQDRRCQENRGLCGPHRAGTAIPDGKLNIVGLDLIGEAEMLRMWTLKEGQPLNPDYPDHF